MTHPAIEHLQQHASALRRLARDLVGAHDADDVLQDAAIEVLRAPPRSPGPMFGWLRQVVHHVASKRRRAEAIRRRHETTAANERAFETAGAATADSLRLLTEWVTALPEPYRSTLLARYVQDLTPAAIAEATGVPVRTVKTRLQRGLAMLRERGDRSGSDWRGAFALAFGFDARDVAVGAAGAAGALTMGAMGKAVVAAAALAIAALTVWQWTSGEGTTAQPSPASPPVAPAVAAIADAPSKPPLEAPGTERTPVATLDPSLPPRAKADEIVVHVVDAASGQAVVAFALREHMSPQLPMLGAKPNPLLHAGDHPDGRVVLPASAFVDRGYVVEDAAGAYLPSSWFAAANAVERDGERTIEVRMPLPVEVRVKVVRERTGEALAGTRVELLRPWVVPHPIIPRTPAAPCDRFHVQSDCSAIAMNFSGGLALLLGDVKTDEAGLAVLRVPPGERLALRLTGALHRTLIVEPWQAPAEPRAEVVLSVATGAAVRGRITPAAALAQLHASVPDVFGPNQAETAQQFATGVRLQHDASGEFRPVGMLGRLPVTLAEDGSFEIGGLAPGTWRMFFRYSLKIAADSPVRPGLPNAFEIELPKLDLTDGELRIVDVDVGDWVPGTLRAHVPRDERMGKEGFLSLTPIASVGPPLATQGQVGVRAAPGERVDVPLPPARYQAIWSRPSSMSETSGTRRIVTPSAFVLGEVTVRPREVAAVDLALDADTVSIQVFEADGTTPVRGTLRLQRVGWAAGIDVDASGAATFDAMPRGELEATFFRWNAERPNGPFTDPIDLGTVRADGKPIVLRLPAR